MRAKNRNDAMAAAIQYRRQSQGTLRGGRLPLCSLKHFITSDYLQTCIASDRRKTAGSYLLVLHNLEQLDENSNDAIRLLQNAIDAKDWQLCRELLRFLHSIDDTGGALRKALAETNVIDIPSAVVPIGVAH